MNFFFAAHPTGDADVIHHVESSKDGKVSEVVNLESLASFYYTQFGWLKNILGDLTKD